MASDAPSAGTPPRHAAHGPLPPWGEESIEERARALVGVRFRRMGRDPARGLDCVGVAMAAVGRMTDAAYAARSGDAGGAAAMIAAAGLRRVDDPRAGDVALIDVGARQLHLAVLTAGGHVHACARLRRVVETPGPPAGAIGYWRA